MKKIVLIAFLSVFANLAMAVPSTNSIYYFVQVDTNGVLVCIGTNFVAANGIATTATVALLVNRIDAIDTNHATRAQGELADSAVQTNHAGRVSITINGELDDYEFLSVRSDANLPTIGFYGPTWAGTNWFGYYREGDLGRGFYRFDDPGQQSEAMFWDTENLRAGLDFVNPSAITNFSSLSLSNVFFRMNTFSEGLQLGYGYGAIPVITYNVEGGTDMLIGAHPPLGGNPDSSGYFWRKMGSTSWKIHDDGNFTSGTHYLAPNGNGGSLTSLTPSQFGAAWYTNEVLAIDGSTNTIIYLGPLP